MSQEPVPTLATLSEVKIEGGSAPEAEVKIEGGAETAPATASAPIEGGAAGSCEAAPPAPAGGEVDGGMSIYVPAKNGRKGRYIKHRVSHRKGCASPCPGSKHQSKAPSCKCYTRRSKAGRPKGSKSRAVYVVRRSKSGSRRRMNVRSKHDRVMMRSKSRPGCSGKCGAGKYMTSGCACRKGKSRGDYVKSHMFSRSRSGKIYRKRKYSKSRA